MLYLQNYSDSVVLLVAILVLVIILR